MIYKANTSIHPIEIQKSQKKASLKNVPRKTEEKLKTNLEANLKKANDQFEASMKYIKPKTDAVYGPATRWWTHVFKAFYPVLIYFMPEKKPILKEILQMMNDYDKLNDSMIKATYFNDLSKENQHKLIEFVQKRLKSRIPEIRETGLEFARALKMNQNMINDLTHN